VPTILHAPATVQMELIPGFKDFNFSILFDPTLAAGPGEEQLERWVDGAFSGHHSDVEQLASVFYWTLRRGAFDLFSEDSRFARRHVRGLVPREAPPVTMHGSLLWERTTLGRQSRGASKA